MQKPYSAEYRNSLYSKTEPQFFQFSPCHKGTHVPVTRKAMEAGALDGGRPPLLLRWAPPPCCIRQLRLLPHLANRQSIIQFSSFLIFLHTCNLFLASLQIKIPTIYTPNPPLLIYFNQTIKHTTQNH